MAEVLPYIPYMVSMGLGSVAYFIKNKRKYKNLKKTIYSKIEQGVKELDFEMISDGAEALRDFDVKYKDLRTGLPKKAFFEKIFRKTRIPKMDKFEELFGIPKELVEDVDTIKKFFIGEKSVDKMNKHLNAITEEEHKENDVLKELRVKLEQVKRRQLARNNKEREVIDNMNLTDKIQELHKEYENLFIKTFQEEKDLQNILQRGIKKQMILKKMRAMKSTSSSTAKMSC